MKHLKSYDGVRLIREYSEFNQYQLGIDVQNPLGPGFGFAIDPGLSIYGTDQDSPYVDYYRRTAGTINRLAAITKGTLNTLDGSLSLKKDDLFLEDIDKYSNIKILRIFRNPSLYLDVYISFDFEEDEFFGVYKNFNYHTKPFLQTEMYSDPRFYYMDQEYKLKLSNYIYKKLEKWFEPQKGIYKVLGEDALLRSKMGNSIKLKKDTDIYVKGKSVNKDGNPYVLFEIDNEEYRLDGNNYYFFNYWFEKIK